MDTVTVQTWAEYQQSCIAKGAKAPRDEYDTPEWHKLQSIYAHYRQPSVRKASILWEYDEEQEAAPLVAEIERLREMIKNQ